MLYDDINSWTSLPQEEGTIMFTWMCMHSGHRTPWNHCFSTTFWQPHTGFVACPLKFSQYTNNLILCAMLCWVATTTTIRQTLTARNNVVVQCVYLLSNKSLTSLWAARINRKKLFYTSIFLDVGHFSWKRQVGDPQRIIRSVEVRVTKPRNRLGTTDKTPSQAQYSGSPGISRFDKVFLT